MTQEQTLSILKSGASVFLTGEAGSGKTYVVNRYASYLCEYGIPYAMTASTGIAATHIRGRTIHSWSGVGVQTDIDEDGFRKLAKNRMAVRRIREAKVLVIDEISMLDARAFSIIERMCRQARGGGSLPFGGLQVILVGDFFQLPPVSKEGESRFAFESSAWEALAPVTCYLSEQYRQEDAELLEILSAIRRGEIAKEHRERLSGRIIGPDEYPDEDLPRLFTHNCDVDRMNEETLARLPGRAKIFQMATRGATKPLSVLIHGCLSPERLELKEGASVMFTKNASDRSYVNGTLGVVTGFDTDTKYPIVRTRDGDSILAEPEEWVIEEGEEIVARIRQIPLRLAWAMTVHKSQGVSLDAAVMDLSRVFEYGQGYVALSRVRRLSGLTLLGLSERAFQIHPDVLARDEVFRHESESAERAYGARSEEEVEKDEQAFRVLCGAGRRKRKTSQKSWKKNGSAENPPSPRLRRGEGKKALSGISGVDRRAELRKQFPKAHTPWKEDEDKWLRRLVQGGANVRSIAKALGRQPSTIRSRMRKFNIEK